MKRKLIGLVTALAICVPMVTPAFAVATENSVEKQAVSQSTLSAEIENLYENTMKEVYRQLEAQDALVLLESYEGIVRKHAEQTVYNKYGISTNAIYYRAEFGGFEHYFNELSYGTLPTEMSVTYLTDPRTSMYLVGDLSLSTQDILIMILGVVPWDDVFTVPDPNSISSLSPISEAATPKGVFSISTLMAIALALPNIVDAYIKDSIAAADMKAKIITSESLEYGTTANVILGWDDYPVITRIDDAVDYNIVYFPRFVEGEENQ